MLREIESLKFRVTYNIGFRTLPITKMVFFMTSANSFQSVFTGTRTKYLLVFIDIRTSILHEAGILNSFL